MTYRPGNRPGKSISLTSIARPGTSPLPAREDHEHPLSGVAAEGHEHVEGDITDLAHYTDTDADARVAAGVGTHASDVDAHHALPIIAPATISAFAPTAGTTWESVGSVTVTQPGYKVAVGARASAHWVDTTSSSYSLRIRVGISLDGGSTYSYGQQRIVDIGTAAGSSTRASVGCAGPNITPATPTGNVIAVLETYVPAGAVGNCTLTGPDLDLLVFPSV